MRNNNSPFVLTESELATLRLIAQGKSYKVIAAACNVQVNTITGRRKEISAKLQISGDNKLLVAEAVKQGILAQDEVTKE